MLFNHPLMKKILLTISLMVLCSDVRAKMLGSLCREGMRALLVDHKTGAELFSYEADTLMFPSSMQKTLLLYLIFEYMNDRDPRSIRFTPSKRAYQQTGSRMFLEMTKSVTLDELIDGVVVVSGNDASVCVAEGMYGTEVLAAEAMESLAKDLGCQNTTVRNVSGLPDMTQMTTARDLVTVARALVSKYPQYFKRFKKQTFTHNKIKQHNRNTALDLEHLGVDGVKSGHTDAAGYGLLFSAFKDGRRLIGVVNGCRSVQETKEMTEQMLTYGYNQFVNICLAQKGSVVVKGAPVYLGSQETVDLLAPRDYNITVPRAIVQKIVVQARYKAPIKAPFSEGAEVGEVEVVWPSGEVTRYPLVAAQTVEPMAFWKRPWALILHWCKKW